MIVKEYANQKIQEWLDGLGSEYGGWIIVDDRTIERPYGWMFFKVTRDFWATRDPRKMPPSNSAILCLKATGEFYIVGTAKRSSDYLIEYENNPDEFCRRYTKLGVI